MLTVEKLRKIANESFEDGDWLCLKSGDVYTLYKIESQTDVEELLEDMEDDVEEDGLTPCIVNVAEDNTIYTDADHAKDWNYFKNTMGI